MNTKSRTQPREALGTDNGKYYTNAHKHTMHCEIIHKSLTQFRAQELHFSDDVSTYRLLRFFRLLCCSFVIATASIRLTWADKFVRMSCCTLLKNVYSLKNPPKNIIKSHLIFYCFLLSVVEDDYCCAAHNFSSAERAEVPSAAIFISKSNRLWVCLALAFFFGFCLQKQWKFTYFNQFSRF